MKIFIDPGHGGRDPGATFGSLLEKEIVLRVALETTRLLVLAGHYVVMSRLADRFVALSQRAYQANLTKADIFVSIHTNADPDEDQPEMPEAKGSEIWIYPGSVVGLRLARCVADQVPIFFTGRRFRGIKEARFTVLKKTAMPAVLLELAFIDTEESSKLLDPVIQQKIAETIVAGIESYARIVI